MFENKSYLEESTQDCNDFYVSGSDEVLKKYKVDLRKYCPPVRNQLILSSCASHAVITAYEIWMKQNKVYVELSELFHYYQARESIRREKDNTGMTLRTACKTLMKDGLCFEKYWRYNINKYGIKPSRIAFFANKILHMMNKYKVKSYFNVQSNKDVITWLDKGVPIIAGIRTFYEFNTAFGKHTLDIEDLKDLNLSGGHAVNVVGYDLRNNRFLIRNSWGRNWGTNGYLWIDMMLWDLICFEQRIILV